MTPHIPGAHVSIRRPRTVIAVSVTVAVLAGGATVAWSSTREQAKPTCSLDVPARVSVDRPYLTPPVRRGADCAAAGVIEASWTAYTPKGAVGSRLFFNWDYPRPVARFRSHRARHLDLASGGSEDRPRDRRPARPPERAGHRPSPRFHLRADRPPRRPPHHAHWHDPPLQPRDLHRRSLAQRSRRTATARTRRPHLVNLQAGHDEQPRRSDRILRPGGPLRLLVPDTADAWGSTSRAVSKL
ncbi:hypothetical protein HDA39_000221 [Kribbella italica]|uniref:Uncharacterized protein n=1 Tax=Kribbella italica TaxID=1540520 RepID=A0A7W9J1S9_9ACTN|nr:hypothetical protein [Kribbella italica]